MVTTGLFDAEGSYTSKIKASPGREINVSNNNRFVIDTRRMPYNNFEHVDMNDRTKLTLANVISVARKLIVMPYNDIAEVSIEYRALLLILLNM